MGYVDEQGGLEQHDGKRKCIIKGKHEQQWECPKTNLQLYYPKMYLMIVFFSLCCMLQVNQARSYVVCICFTESQSGRIDEGCLKLFMAFGNGGL